MRRSPALLLCTATLLATSLAVATADRDRRPRVAADIEHVVSTPTSAGQQRAILGRDGDAPFLALDEVAGGRVTRTTAIVGATQGRRWLRFGAEVTHLWPGQWSGNQFQLWAWLDGAWQSCTVELGADRARCGGARDDAMAAARACDPLFTSSASRDACAEAVLGFGQDPRPLLAACDAGFDGDDAELACLRVAVRGAAPVAAIGACEAAFDGDANELTCLDAVANVAEPATLVTFCEQRENGDDAELACLRRFAR